LKALLNWQLTLLLWCLAVIPASADESLRARLDSLAARGFEQLGATRIDYHPLLREFYTRIDFRPAWSHAATRAALLQSVRDAALEGLDPLDYHLPALEHAASVTLSPADRELLHTDALLRLAAHHFHGKLHPLDHTPDIDLHSVELGPDPMLRLAQAIEDNDIAGLLQQLTPAATIYHRLRDGLATHRAIAAGGGWPGIDTGATLRRGDRSPRVAMLRQRLRISNDLRTPDDTDPELFDAQLEQAVRHAQQRHQLAVDGAVGKNTLAALNVPVSARIAQIRVNLERARWLLHDLPATYVLVDIAGFEVRYVRDGEQLLQSRAMVGRPYRKTPVFRAAISYLELNPHWTVPPTILRNDVLPEIRKDIGYLQQRDMQILSLDGREVDPATIDFSALRGRNFPYLIRQRPGPDNALGQIKFMFPNQYMVYLHDTPARNLFAQPQRAFSSGCIRIERARELAALLLQQQGWDEAQLDAAIATGQTRKLVLQQAVPILLYYWTVAIEDDGDVLFKPDIYQRDAALLAALNHPNGDPDDRP